MLIKAFIASFFFSILLLVTVIFAEDVMNKQGIYYPPLLKNLKRATPLSYPKTTPMPVAVIGNGDANANSLVDFGDVHYISSYWNNSASGAVDQYQDGKINSFDFAVTANELSK